MPSDAYMELSDPAVWGETYDSQFGMEGPGARKLGAFEISSFDFGISAKEDEKKDAKKGEKTKSADSAGGDKAPSKHDEPTIDHFTITKFIDKASPDLFQACLLKTDINWAIISVRESGEVNKKPYLVIEFQNLKVKDFSWKLNPGDAESTEQFETVDFEFETIVIKYSRQERGGEHKIVKVKGWNRKTNKPFDTEIDTSLIQAQHITQ